MDFEGWWKKTYPNINVPKDESYVKNAWEAGIQEGIDRMYRLYDICPECRLPNGQHKMDCGRRR